MGEDGVETNSLCPPTRTTPCCLLVFASPERTPPSPARLGPGGKRAPDTRCTLDGCHKFYVHAERFAGFALPATETRNGMCFEECFAEAFV